MDDKEYLKAWSAGFIDGEGSFVIEVKRYKDGRAKDVYLRPKFTVQLRRDDEDSLRLLQVAIENDGYFYRRRKRKVSTFGSVSKPTSECSWHSMDSLWAVVALLDEYPLMSKKARDYAIWREAVLIYVNQKRPSQERQKALGPLRKALQEVKKYPI